MGEAFARLAVDPVVENLYSCDSPWICDRLWHKVIGRLLRLQSLTNDGCLVSSGEVARR